MESVLIYKDGCGVKQQVAKCEYIPEFKKNSNGNYCVPMHYVMQSLLVKNEDVDNDFASIHKWTPELWKSYMTTTLTIMGNSILFWSLYTFNEYIVMLDKQLRLYMHPLNKKNDWNVFLENYKQKFNFWYSIFSDDSFDIDDNSEVVYSATYQQTDYSKLNLQKSLESTYLDHLAYILDIKLIDDERIVGDVDYVHRQIMQEASQLWEMFLAEYRKNTIIKFSSWFNSIYHLAYHMKKENPCYDFNYILDYIN